MSLLALLALLTLSAALVVWLMARTEREIETRPADEPTPWQRELSERAERVQRATDLHETQAERRRALEEARREVGA